MPLHDYDITINHGMLLYNVHIIRLTQPPPGCLGPHHEGVHGSLHMHTLLIHPGTEEVSYIMGYHHM